MDSGYFEPVKREMKAGDFLFIQFGHNDEKADVEALYTTPFGTYKDNPKTYIPRHSIRSAASLPSMNFAMFGIAEVRR